MFTWSTKICDLQRRHRLGQNLQFLSVSGGFASQSKEHLHSWSHSLMQLWQPLQRVPSSFLCDEVRPLSWLACGPWLHHDAVMHLPGNLSNLSSRLCYWGNTRGGGEGKSVRINRLMQDSLGFLYKFVVHWKLLAARMNIRITHLRQPEIYLRQ